MICSVEPASPWTLRGREGGAGGEAQQGALSQEVVLARPSRVLLAVQLLVLCRGVLSTTQLSSLVLAA